MNNIEQNDLHCDCCNKNAMMLRFINIICGLTIAIVFLVELSGCATLNPKPLQNPVFSKKEEPWVELPKDIKRGPGDCAIWATAVNNRRIDLTLQGTPVTQKEWDNLRQLLHTDDTGTSVSDIMQYYKDRGFTLGIFEPDTCYDYSAIINFLEQGCVIFRHFEPKAPGAAHIEPITSAFSFDDTCFLITNSWGRHAVVQGFSKKVSSHTYFKEYTGPEVLLVDIIACPNPQI